jgi:uncharacterized YccA/Bax inhibitor family protein
MNFGKSNNPMFSNKAIAKAKALDSDMYGNNRGGAIIEETMTVSGAVNKTIMLTMLMSAVALFSYTSPMYIFIPVGALGAAAVYMFTSWKPQYSPITAPLFAMLEGLFVGTISWSYAMQFEGIVFQALSATIGVLLTMLMVYKSGLIKVTKKFRMGVTMAVGAIMILYFISWIGHFVGFEIPYLHEGGVMGIGITVVIIGVASLNLLLDFDNFDKGEEAEAPKFMEWYYGMGLLFTLVWLYVEFLRLISKLSRD